MKRIIFAGAVISCWLAASAADVVATFDCVESQFSIGPDGRLQSLVEKGTGRNLLRWAARCATVVTQDGVQHPVAQVEKLSTGHLRLTFEKTQGEAEISVSGRPWGFLITAEKLTVPQAKEFWFFCVYPVCRKWCGAMMNAMSDEKSAVVLRSCELTTEMRLRGNTVLEAVAQVAEHPGALPARAALVIAPREKVLALVDRMGCETKALMTACGGARSLAAPENRESYLIAHVSRDSVDDWIALAERGGFGLISFYDWWKTLGHYGTNTKFFPGGDADMKACIDRIHAAGLKCGMHTLTAGINFHDTWVSPVCHDDLLVLARYTLARPFRDGDAEMWVNEKPIAKHDVVTSFLSNGNNLRIGGEVFTYTGIRSEAAPYAFTGVKRAARGTRNTGEIAAGTRVEYLFQHFFTFFPEPSSPFMDEMAALLAKRYADFGFDFVYHDGAEPMSRYNVDVTRHKFTGAMDQSAKPLQVEASIGGAHNWWFHSRLGAWDHPRWAAKRFHDIHLANCRGEAVNANMMAAQVGWWSVLKADGNCRGHFTDEAEYFASQNAGNDFAMSVVGVEVTKGPLAFSVERQMTIIGRYERFRRALAFTDDAVRKMSVPRAEFRLVQNRTSGGWELAPTVVAVHRVPTPDFRAWDVVVPEARQGSLRVEALYAAEEKDGVALIGPKDLSAFAYASAKDVKISARAATDAQRGEVICLCAENAGQSRRGSWATAGLAYAHPFRDATAGVATRRAYGFWVKGDGSGAVLALHLRSPSIYCGGESHHFVRLDFTGWRRVTAFLRERDAALYGDFAWPGYYPFYHVHRDLVMPDKIDRVDFVLNEVPAGGRTEVAVSPVEVLSERKTRSEGCAVVVNGQNHAVPFALESGHYAELEDGVWTQYSEMGEPLGTVRTGERIRLAGGTNACAFVGDGASRAEVTVMAMGQSIPALKPLAHLSPEAHKLLAYEALDPVMYAPSKGFDRPFLLATRPGESACLDMEILGPLDAPSFDLRALDGRRLTFELPVTLGEGEKLLLRKGRDWRVVKDFKTLRSGQLSEPIPAISGVYGVRVQSRNPEAAHARISLIKRYNHLL